MDPACRGRELDIEWVGGMSQEDRIQAALDRIVSGLTDLHSIVVLLQIEHRLMDERVDRLDERVKQLESLDPLTGR